MAAVEGDGRSYLESELVARIVRMQSWGVWVLVEEAGLRRGDESLKLASTRVRATEYPLIFSSQQVDGAVTETPFRFIRVSSDWLLEELGPNCMVLLDPFDLPAVRVRLDILRRPAEDT